MRRLLVHSTYNMRELGGYPTLDGGATLFGRFIRSELPVRLTESDIAYLKDYGLKYVFDLRSEWEAEHRPNPLCGVPGIEYHNVVFSDNPVFYYEHFCPLDHYIPLLRDENGIGKIMTAMAECPDDGAILFNCLAGKDRTGITSALLLLLANVPSEDVMADYQVTHTYISPFRFAIDNDGLPSDSLSWRSDAQWLEPVFQYLSEQGGVERYLMSLGLTKEQLDRLRYKLTGKENRG